jgi:hypothetical protein
MWKCEKLENKPLNYVYEVVSRNFSNTWMCIEVRDTLVGLYMAKIQFGPAIIHKHIFGQLFPTYINLYRPFVLENVGNWTNKKKDTAG